LNYGTPSRSGRNGVSSCFLPPPRLRHGAVVRHAEQALQLLALRDHARAVVDAVRDRSRPRTRREAALRRALRTRGLGVPAAFADSFYFDPLANTLPPRRRADAVRIADSMLGRARLRGNRKKSEIAWEKLPTFGAARPAPRGQAAFAGGRPRAEGARAADAAAAVGASSVVSPSRSA